MEMPKSTPNPVVGQPGKQKGGLMGFTVVVTACFMHAPTTIAKGAGFSTGPSLRSFSRNRF